MQSRSFLVPFVALVALLTPALDASAQTDPVSILQRYVDARNEADEAGAIDLVADYPLYADDVRCPSATPCTGQHAVLVEIRQAIADHAHQTLIGFPTVTGATITARAQLSSDTVSAAGLDRVIYDLTAEVRDGKLTRIVAVQDTSDAQTATFQALQRAQPPAQDLAPRTHDDWMLPSTTPSPDLSPRTHDDWPLDQ
jgi:hypothetical protein